MPVAESRSRANGWPRCGARPSEVIFTGGGTESDNLAVRASSGPAEGRPRLPAGRSSAVENHAVLDSVDWLAEPEGRGRWLPGTPRRLEPEDLRAELTTYAAGGSGHRHGANNEVGTVQRSPNWPRRRRHGVPFPPTPSSRRPGAVDFAASGCRALTVTGHSGRADRGGRTAARPGRGGHPLLHGGGQERDVGPAHWTPQASSPSRPPSRRVKGQQEYAARVTALRDNLIERVRRAVPR